MKLIFTKNDSNEIAVYRKSGKDQKEFKYVDMVKTLIKTRSLEDPELDGEFSEAEKQSVLSMISHINQEVERFYADDEDPA